MNPHGRLDGILLLVPSNRSIQYKRVGVATRRPDKYKVDMEQKYIEVHQHENGHDEEIIDII